MAADNGMIGVSVTAVIAGPIAIAVTGIAIGRGVSVAVPVSGITVAIAVIRITVAITLG
jgi:hypothetical protein